MKLFIADDEIDVREGIRYLIDWGALDFTICGEGKNGQEALDNILKYQPDLVLLDIRMPKLTGLEVIRLAREAGFVGKFIILSGYSDFSYAQEAIRYGVNCYLTKPIDEDELEKAVIEAKEAILSEQKSQKQMVQYRSQARESILKDILMNKADYPLLDSHDLLLDAPVFQVIIYTNYNQKSFQTTWDFASILRLANKNHDSLESITMKNQNIILLKGDFALNRFRELLSKHIYNLQEGSPLASLFFTYGRPVYRMDDIHLSFEDADHLMKRRFFCKHKQHTLGYEEFEDSFLKNAEPDSNEIPEDIYAVPIANYIQSGNKHMIQETLETLQSNLSKSNINPATIRHFVADILIHVKSILLHTYENVDMPFAGNLTILSEAEETCYLYELIEMLTTQFEACMAAIASPSRENIMDDILQYIDHNYNKNLKLGTIAELFGYNSSYLGKVFHKSTGKSFNAYIDEVRISNSKLLLLNEEHKVYEIAQMVGYSNVDYFHKKFKKYVGMSPAEYRKQF